MILSASNVDAHLNSDRLNMLFKVADQFHQAQCFTKDVANTFQAFVKIQAGAEMGMAPMESMTALYIVNGNVTMWGKALTQRLRQFGWRINYDDSKPDECTATVNKGEETYSYTSTKAELEALKSRAAGFALKDKLKWHAISRICRFYVPEVLGSVSYVKEEVDDLPDFTQKIPSVTATNLDVIEAPKEEPKPVPETKTNLDTTPKQETVSNEIIIPQEKENIEEVKIPEGGFGAVQKSKPVLPPTTNTNPEEPMKPFTEFAGVEPKTHREKLIDSLMNELADKPDFDAEPILEHFMVSSLGELLEGQVEYAIKWVKTGKAPHSK